jgi:hypothetical protein
VRVYASAMSIPVAIADLAAATSEYGYAYLLTVRDDLRAHVVAVTPTWDGESLVMQVGRGTARNATRRPSISLCYPPRDEGGYSLIVDGDAVVEDDSTITFAPTAAVLHRPAPVIGGGSAACGNEPVGPSGG